MAEIGQQCEDTPSIGCISEHVKFSGFGYFGLEQPEDRDGVRKKLVWKLKSYLSKSRQQLTISQMCLWFTRL